MKFTSNSWPMKRQLRWIIFILCASLCVCQGQSTASTDDETDAVVRPSGVHKRKHTTQPAKRSRAHKRAADSSDEDKTAETEATPAVPTQPSDPNRVPNTRANSVMVVDARTGQILYEKNADQPRPAASTQKLLTALVIADTGYIDRQVSDELIDKFAVSVYFNIR